MKILILGGYGVFGGRLAHLLSDLPNVNILICGRSYTKAEKFCSSLGGNTNFTPIALDRDAISEALISHKPDILVDASGPFQDYGNDPYDVVKSCIQAKVNYLDFADAADFVFGITKFDEIAKKAGIFILSGVSSFPVLTAAVLRNVANDMQIESVVGGIAPSPYAGIGINVMRAVIGYAGESIKLTRNGKIVKAKALTESIRFTVAPPGLLPLHNLRFSLVDVPDLQVIPAEHETITDIWMGAGPVPESLHLILNLLAKARGQFKLPSLKPLSSLFYLVLNLMKFGEDRGGMFVQIKGTIKGQAVTRSWHLLAEGDDGPYIPSMAIEAIVRNWINGDTPNPGARPATRELSLNDYDKLFEKRTIYTGQRCSQSNVGSLYQQILGSSFDKLPTQLQAIHSPQKKHQWVGHAKVVRGNNPIARIVAHLIGFPVQASRTPVSVTFTPKNNSELWVRKFGEKTFRSFQKIGTGRNNYLLTEHFGLMTVALALVLKNNRLYLVPRRWSMLGIPLPKFLLPNGESFEQVKDGIFQFNVSIKAPLIGLIVSYQGSLKPSVN